MWADGDRLFPVQLASGTQPNFGKVQIRNGAVHYKFLRLTNQEAFDQSCFYSGRIQVVSAYCHPGSTALVPTDRQAPEHFKRADGLTADMGEETRGGYHEGASPGDVSPLFNIQYPTVKIRARTRSCRAE